MIIDFASRVEIGKRETNDDRALVSNQMLDMTSHSGELSLPALAVVCDGCGGYAGGGIAAETVLEVLSNATIENLSEPNNLAAVLDSCQQAVMKKKKDMPQFSGMCTTVAGCVFCEDCVNIFHAGDSRVYRYDGFNLARMTRDHSVVQNMIDLGQLTEADALVSPGRNIINRCIGINCPLPEIYVSRVPIGPGEMYLLCSDGLWESVDDSEMKRILSSDLPLEQMVDQLIERALELGSDDNISVCICSRRGNANVVVEKPFILD